MRKNLLLALFFIFLLGLAFVGVMVAAAQTSSGFDLSWYVVSGGGGFSQTTGYELSSTVGQTAAGDSSSSGTSLSHGFWQNFIEFLLTRLPFTVKH